MSQLKVAAEASLASAYRAMKRPAKAGDLRTKSWRTAVAVADDDPLWAARAKAYWMRQELIYGLKFFDSITNLADVVDGVPLITSCAVVERVLPGRRVVEGPTQ